MPLKKNIELELQRLEEKEIVYKVSQEKRFNESVLKLQVDSKQLHWYWPAPFT